MFVGVDGPAATATTEMPVKWRVKYSPVKSEAMAARVPPGFSIDSLLKRDSAPRSASPRGTVSCLPGRGASPQGARACLPDASDESTAPPAPRAREDSVAADCVTTSVQDCETGDERDKGERPV